MPKIKNDMLRVLMAKRGIGRDDMAERIGMSDVSMRHYLTGRNDPKEETVRRIARELGVAPETLLAMPPAETPEEARNRVWYLVNRYREEWSEIDRKKIAARLLRMGEKNDIQR